MEANRLRQGGRLTIDFVLTIAEQVLVALEYAHGLGWLHRDISPRNLLITSSNELKVLDLGVCRAIELSGVLTSITGPALLGTPGFIAPEQARGDWAQLDVRADLWSLGATIFLLFSGQHVHKGNRDEQMRAAITLAPRTIREGARSAGWHREVDRSSARISPTRALGQRGGNAGRVAELRWRLPESTENSTIFNANGRYLCRLSDNNRQEPPHSFGESGKDRITIGIQS